MSLFLNTKTITDEVFALTALRAVASPEAERQRVLTRDQLPALRVAIRMAFAWMVTELAGVVSECRLSDEDPDPRQPYDDVQLVLSVDLSLPVSLTDGQLLALRRQLEHTVALMVLSYAYGGSDRVAARSFADEAAASIESVRVVAALPPAGVRVRGVYY